MADDDLEAVVYRLISLIGDDPDREGLIGTPDRVARAYGELFEGYSYSDEDIQSLLKTFDAPPSTLGAGENMVWVSDIPFHSTCEHHLLPFYGSATVAYIPDDKIIGLSKIPRVVSVLAHKLQVQERLTQEICDALTKKTRGAAVYMRSTHMCLASRGHRSRETQMETMSYGGVFVVAHELARRFEARL